MRGLRHGPRFATSRTDAMALEIVPSFHRNLCSVAHLPTSPLAVETLGDICQFTR